MQPVTPVPPTTPAKSRTRRHPVTPVTPATPAKSRTRRRRVTSPAAAKSQPPVLTQPGSPKPPAYEAKKARERERQAAAVRSGQDIGPIPACLNPARRAEGESSPQRFAEIYLADRFPLPWAPDHCEQWTEIARIVRYGGLQAIGAPRGDGKTTRLEAGILWAVLYGYHDYAALLTATQKHAPRRIGSIKTALMTSQPLLEDFPEVCVPVRAMNGRPNKCAGMTSEGRNLWPASNESQWGKTRIVLPTVPGSKASGATLESAGLIEAIRGLNWARPDGKITRPTLCLLDDPQTDRTARSLLQCAQRAEAIAKGILFLAGPAKQMSALAALTVIEPGDMADEMLDRKMHPEWHGIRKQMLYAFPTATKLWDEYGDIYRDELAEGSESFPRSTEFYAGHREAMNAGAVVAWEHRHPGATSAIEYAMRLMIKDRSSFFSECQNAPELDVDQERLQTLTSEQIATHVSAWDRYQIAAGTQHLTWFVDVHKELLYYAVAAWRDGFTGQVIDYGTWPQQDAVYFDLRHARRTIDRDKRITATSLEGKITQALDALFGELAARNWRSEDGAERRLDLGLVDANWGETTSAVYDACRAGQKKYGLRIHPSHGIPFGPGKKPISRWDRKSAKGQVGDEWQIPPPSRGRSIRHVLFDAGRRKSFLQRRLATPIGDPGSLTLFHAPASRHRLLAEHLTAETGTKVSGPWGDQVDWRLIVGWDNHWLDCLSGCCTGESILGGKLKPLVQAAAAASTASKPKSPTKAVRYMTL